MKTRIIAMLLLAVMLVSVLSGCGYSYMKEDYDKYVTFDKEKLDKLLLNVEIEDGDFTANEETREKKVWDNIYNTLAGKADKEAKITEGKVKAHDILYYCYYATVENADKQPVVIMASKMDETKATKLQLGLSTNEGVAAEIEKLIGAYEFKDNAYKTTTTGKGESGKTAYITYTVEYKETVDGAEKTKTTTYTYAKVTLGDENHPVAKKLAGYDIGTVFKDAENNNKTTITEGDKTYSNIKINWVVESGEGFSFTHKTYTTKTTEKSVDGVGMELKDKELTYHVFPVYYLSVAEYSAAELLKNVFTNVTVDTLPSFEGKEDAIKALNELKKAFSDAKTKTADAKKNVETAQKALDKAKDAVKDDKPTDAQQTTIDAAQKSLDDNKKALTDAQTAQKTAEDALDAGIAKFYETVNATIIETEYKQNVYDGLLNDYNNVIKNNLAKAIWTAMQDYSKVAIPSNKAIKPVYDRMMEAYEYDFYNGTSDDVSKKSNYALHNGDFDRFLKVETGVGASADVIKAKDKVWGEAEAYVKEVFVVFAVAKAYDLAITKADMKAFREDENSSYSYYEYTYGDSNVQVAVQFDKLMDHILEWNTKGTGEDETVVYVEGKIDFVRVNYTVTEHKH